MAPWLAAPLCSAGAPASSDQGALFTVYQGLPVKGCLPLGPGVRQGEPQPACLYEALVPPRTGLWVIGSSLRAAETDEIESPGLPGVVKFEQGGGPLLVSPEGESGPCPLYPHAPSAPSLDMKA